MIDNSGLCLCICGENFIVCFGEHQCRVKRVLIGCSIGPCARLMLEITPARGYTTYHFSLDTTLGY